MQQHYELSDTEYKIMQLFWKNSDPLPFNEILKYCNDELQLNWAVGTAQTYLNRLILKGVLKQIISGIVNYIQRSSVKRNLHKNMLDSL